LKTDIPCPSHEALARHAGRFVWLAVDTEKFTRTSSRHQQILTRSVLHCLEVAFERSDMAAQWRSASFPQHTGDGYVVGVPTEYLGMLINPLLTELQGVLEELSPRLASEDRALRRIVTGAQQMNGIAQPPLVPQPLDRVALRVVEAVAAPGALAGRRRGRNAANLPVRKSSPPREATRRAARDGGSAPGFGAGQAVPRRGRIAVGPPDVPARRRRRRTGTGSTAPRWPLPSPDCGCMPRNGCPAARLATTTGQAGRFRPMHTGTRT
jgi:hypothetical protein